MGNDFASYLEKYKSWRDLTGFLKGVHFGKKKTTLYTFIKVFFISLYKDDILEIAKGIAYNFTLAIFPAIIVLFALIPYFPIPDLSETVLGFIEGIDLEVLDQVTPTVEDIINTPRGGLLSFSFLFAFYLATNGTLTLMNAFDLCYKTKYTRSYFKRYFIAGGLTILLVVTMSFSMILLIGGQIALKLLVDFGILTESFLIFLITALRFIVLFAMFLMAMSFLYYFGPAVKDRWSFISPGSVVATLLVIAISYSFSYYLANFGQYHKFYGSIGAIIAFMIWLYLVAVVLLFGFEVNAGIDRANHEKYVVEFEE
ncbi:YihY/virulence factor BrkB family protein [Bacteroidota bacterium]